jgi:hypothetical protein
MISSKDMENPEYPALRQTLLPPKPSKPQPTQKPKTKGRGKRKAEEEEEETTPFELAEDDITNVGPILYRAQQQRDNYVLVLKNDQSINFHRANWTSSGEDSFITLYRKTAHTWEVIDVCIDDISTVAISLPAARDPLSPSPENAKASLDKA